jgi:polyhydroxyalkanoate synthesis regulator phasin
MSPANSPSSSGAKRAAAKGRTPSAGPAAPEGLASIADQLIKGTLSPKDLLMLTTERIQETLDDAAARGRVTRKDANELAVELVRRGRQQSDELLAELEALIARGQRQLGTARRRARSPESVDRLVRGADMARRAAAGTGNGAAALPIAGYDELTARQVQVRIRELDGEGLRRVLAHEREHANRKSVVGPLEKALR